MTGVIIGKVTDVKLGKILIEDHISREIIECESDGDDILDLKIGDQAIFVGTIYHGRIRVKKYEIRKFLDPLYEEDLFDASGKFTLIPPVANPFTEAFIEFMDKRRREDSSHTIMIPLTEYTDDSGMSYSASIKRYEDGEFVYLSTTFDPESCTPSADIEWIASYLVGAENYAKENLSKLTFDWEDLVGITETDTNSAS